MYLASAYPNSAISAATMTAIALVTAGSLALWLLLVFLADRKGSGKAAAPRADSHLAVVTQPDQAAEDKHEEAGHAPADGRSAAAA